MIEEHLSLQPAEIISAEGYFEHAIRHRFLILELRRRTCDKVMKKPIWARLERRADRPALSLVRTLGSAPSKDTVRTHLQHCLEVLANEMCRRN